MSVNHSAFIGIGRRMCSLEEAKDFVCRRTTLTEEDVEAILDCNYMGDVCVDIVCLDAFSGDDWFVGSAVGKTQEPQKLDGCVADALSTWEELFPNEQARVVWAVIYS